MARRAKLWVTGFALALVALWSTEDAFAGDKMRVCVLKISGTRDNDLKNDIIRLINQPYSMLKSSTFFKTATRMRIGKKLSPPNLRRLAKFLRLGAMIDGSLVAKSGRYTLVLKVRDGRSGVVVERIRHTLRGKNLNESEKKRLRRDLISALERIRLDSAAGASGAGGFGRDDDEEEEQEEKEDKKVPVDDLEDDSGVDDLEDEEEKDVAPRRKTRAQLAAERRAARAEKRRKAREERIARRKAAEEKRRKAREERIARRKAAEEKRRQAREEARRKRQQEAERRRKEREARKAAKSDEEDDLEEDDLESDLEEDDLEGDDLEDDLEEDEESDVEGDGAATRTAAADDEEEEDVADDPVVTKTPDKDAGPGGAPAVIANAGLGAFSRTLTFDSDGALMGAERPIDYEGGFVPSAFVDLELYPMALTGGSGLLADIGIDARFEQALSLSSTVDPDGGSADNAFDVDTTYRRFGVGLRYRLQLSSVLIGLRVGYGQSAFELDKGAAMGMVDIPNIKYSYVDPGLVVSYPLGKLSIDVAARFLAMLSAGEIQESTSYGQTKILGLDADAGLNYLVTSKIGVRLGLRLAQMNLTFRGTGDLSDRNNDMAQDVDSATDRYVGGYLTGSYRF